MNAVTRDARQRLGAAVRSDADQQSARRLEALMRLLGRLTELHEQLRAILGRKIELMRSADLDGLQQCVQEQRGVVVQIQQQEGMRRQLAEQIGRGFGMSAPVARQLSVQKLAERVGAPYADGLRAAAARLKAAVREVEGVNGFIGRVSADMLRHVDELFASVRGEDEPAIGYTGRGSAASPRRRELFEAIG